MPVDPLTTVWDDLLEGVGSADDWSTKRPAVMQRFRELLRQDAAPPLPRSVEVTVEDEKHLDDMTVRRISYPAEPGDIVTAWMGIPAGSPSPSAPW